MVTRPMDRMFSIHTLIVDDERASRLRMRRLLGTEPDVEVLGECSNGPEAVAFMAERPPDLLFLDVELPGLDGFSVMETMVAKSVPMVVFVTAFDGYALRAFDVHAFDYLVKPFDLNRFQETLRRVRVQFERLRNGGATGRVRTLEDGAAERRSCNRLAIRTPGHIAIVRTEDIDWIEASDNYVLIHCGAETHVLRETMNTIETRLSKVQFQRVHRSTIVNIDRIKELQTWIRGDYRILLRDGTQLTLSRTYRESLEASLVGSS
jgi:two-component system LytT family response regulator